MNIKKLEQLDITKRPDLRSHPDLQASRPPPVGVCVESGVFQYNGTNLVQWWIARGGVWTPYKDVYVIVEDKDENKD